MSPILMTLLVVVAVAAFVWQMRDRLLILPKLQPAKRFDRPWQRIQRTVIYAFVQKNMFRRPLAGCAHLVIFLAFVTTIFATLANVIRGFKLDFAWPLPPTLMAGYNFTIDFFWTLCFAGIAYWLTQRVIIRPWRFRTAGHKWKALLVLGFISGLALSEFFARAADLAAAHSGFTWEMPTSSVIGLWLQSLGASPSTLSLVLAAAIWTHVIIVFSFLNLLPSGKHFHVIWAIPNIYTSNLDERGHIDPPNLETAEKFGAATIADLSWKQAVDTYSCTECGRCLEYCPTALTGKPLTHRGVNLALKQELHDYAPNLIHLAQKKADVAPLRELVNETGAALSPETIWACTTCGSCEVECPVLIEQVPRIIQMRQNLVLMRGEFPAELNRTFKGMEQHSNPWGMNAENRDKWAEGLDIPRLADIVGENKEIPLLYWIGCAGSFDERVKKITVAMVKILRAANVPFAILGKEEGCTGEPARRLGNEYLFQTLATANIETLKNYKVKRILTHCPHCLQTLKNDYKGLGGGDWEVVHHTQLIHELVSQGKVKPTKQNVGSVVFHDSCYLARYNDIHEAPRQVLRSIPSLKVLEFDNNRSRGVCCGAGGGRFWMEEKIGTRINHHRLEDGLAKNPDTVGSGCPFCLTMLSDGIKDKGLEEKVGAQDVAEIFAASL